MGLVRVRKGLVEFLCLEHHRILYPIVIHLNVIITVDTEQTSFMQQKAYLKSNKVTK